ncbi:hypothetical protein IMSAGC002_03897 [Lachnospiraceae bacterium]|nr:hypothetical protein IMSAGC002_03897 [Lachnospiraceae bacterium]
MALLPLMKFTASQRQQRTVEAADPGEAVEELQEERSLRVLWMQQTKQTQH